MESTWCSLNKSCFSEQFSIFFDLSLASTGLLFIGCTENYASQKKMTTHSNL